MTTTVAIDALMGRELDAATAEAMALPVVWAPDPYTPSRLPEGRHPWLKGLVNGCEYDWAPVPRYTYPFGDLEVVLKWLREREWVWGINLEWDDQRGCWLASVNDCQHEAGGAELPLAVCRLVVKVAAWEREAL